MSCQDIHALLPLRPLGVLEGDEETRLAEHLRACQDCQQRSADFGGALTEFKDRARAVKAPRDKVWSRIAGDLTPTPPPRPRDHAGKAISISSGLALLGLAAALGFGLAQEPPPPQGPQPSRRARPAPSPAPGPSPTPAAMEELPAEAPEAPAPIPPAPAKKAPVIPEEIFEVTEQDGVTVVVATGGQLPLPVRVSTAFKRAHRRFFGSEVSSRSGGAAEILELSPPSSKKTWKRSRVGANALRVRIGEGKELPLRGLQMRVRVDGFRARVVLDGLFENADDKRYEGRFQLRLPDGASPYFLAFGQTVLARDPEALDAAFLPADAAFDPEAIMKARGALWKQPLVARVVPRSRAVDAYKATVRRRVDPALLEWAGAGIFQARVFPLMPKKTHRIIVAYDLALHSDRAERVLRLDLPPAPRRVVDLAVTPIPGVKHRLNEEERPVPRRRDGRYRFEGAAASSLELRLRTPKTRPRRIHGEFFAIPGGLVLTHNDEAAGPRFAATAKAVFRREESPTAARRAVFLVDTSLSADPERFNLDRSLLEAILEGNREQIKEFAVLFFDAGARWYRRGFVANERAEVEALLRFTDQLALEGATDLGRALDEATKPAWAEESGGADLFLLSDGAANWGEDEDRRLRLLLGRPGVGALFAYRDGRVANDSRRLARLAEASGGALFTVASEKRLAAAARAHRARPWIIESVALAGGRDLLLAGRPRSLFPGQELTVVGRGIPEDDAELRLSLRRGDDRQELALRLPYRLESNLASRAYGQVAVCQLEDLTEGPSRIAEDYAVHYRVPGRTCSLLMLESEADYRRFGIRPEGRATKVVAHPARTAIENAAPRDDSSKAAFLSMLKRLDRARPGGLRLRPESKRWIESRPEAAFEWPVAPLAGEPGLRSAMSPALRVERGRLFAAFAAEAKRRRDAKDPASALRALSSLVELRPGSPPAAREAALTLLAWGRFDQAYHLFRRVAEARLTEAPSYRWMALCAAEAGRSELAIACFEVALSLWSVDRDSWLDGDAVVAYDYLRLLRRMARDNDDASLSAFAGERLVAFGEAHESKGYDLVIVMSWSSDNTDLDLLVHEPGGEEAYLMGGGVARDRSGFGPEMYRLRVAGKGTYEVSARYSNSDPNRTSTRSQVALSIILNWGRENETVTRRVVSFEKSGEERLVAKVILK